MPIFFQFVHGDSPIDAAVRLLPIIITFVVFGLCGGFIVSKTGHYYPWFLSAGVLTTLGASLLCKVVQLHIAYLTLTSIQMPT
jgi:hypothetical protein